MREGGLVCASVRTWEGTTERRVRAVVLAAAGVGRKEVERESVMADDDGLASRQSLRLLLFFPSSYLSPR